MWKKWMVLGGILILGLSAGCGRKDSAALEREGSETLGDADAGGKDVLADEEGGHAELDGAEKDSEEVLPADDGKRTEAGVESGDTPTSSEEGEPDDKRLDIADNGRRLTSEELAAYTEWVQDVSNYGFLLSDWENPAQINLYQVFYCGAGISREGTEEEKQAHMARWDQPEIYTDFWAMDKADVDALLTEKVGFTYDELVAEGNKGMEEDYYAETDSFCVEAGDTNYCEFLCTDGFMDEDGTTVTLYCDGDDWVRTCEVKVSVAGDQRTFLGNHIAEGMVRDMEEYSETHAEE